VSTPPDAARPGAAQPDPAGDSPADPGSYVSAAGLAAGLIEAESARRDRQAAANRDVLFSDDLLPGVGGEPVSLSTARAPDGATFAFGVACENYLYARPFTAPDGTVTPATQANLVRALAFGLVPDQQRERVAADPVKLIRAAGNHLGTGFLAIPFLLPVLADHGHLTSSTTCCCRPPCRPGCT
jgi:hypothetical protein